MLKPHSPALRRYGLGLACVFAGAWLTELSGSMIPLSMGAAASLMWTLPLVRSIWRGKQGGDG